MLTSWIGLVSIILQVAKAMPINETERELYHCSANRMDSSPPFAGLEHWLAAMCTAISQQGCHHNHERLNPDQSPAAETHSHLTTAETMIDRIYRWCIVLSESLCKPKWLMWAFAFSMGLGALKQGDLNLLAFIIGTLLRMYRPLGERTFVPRK